MDAIEKQTRGKFCCYYFYLHDEILKGDEMLKRAALSSSGPHFLIRDALTGITYDPREEKHQKKFWRKNKSICTNSARWVCIPARE